MLDLRSPLIWAAPCGVIAAALLWSVAGGPLSRISSLDEVEGRLAASSTGASPRQLASGPDPVAQAIRTPIFAAANTPEPTIRLIGVSRTPRRVAALVSINGAEPEWLERGATKDGLTLQDVLPSKIVVDSVGGTREIGLWDKPPAETASGSRNGQPPGSATTSAVGG